MAEPETHQHYSATTKAAPSTVIEPVSAADLLLHAESHTERELRLSTTVVAIDKLLDGGLQRGKVTEVWGPPGSGRSALAWVTF